MSQKSHGGSTCGPGGWCGKQAVPIFCTRVTKCSKETQKVRVRVAIVQKHGRVDGCEGLRIVAHCVSGLFSGFVGYENCWRNGECCRMGFHWLSLLFYHACDWRSEECSGSRHCTSYPEKQRSQSCVKICSLACKSLCNIVYGSAVNFHSGNHIVLWAYLFMGVTAPQYHGWSFDGEHWPTEASSVCMPGLPGCCGSTPWRLWLSPLCLGARRTLSPITFSTLTLCQRNEDIQFCALLELLFCD